MRRELSYLYGQRHSFFARVAKFGTRAVYRTNFRKETVLLTGVSLTDDCELVASHIWVPKDRLRGWENVRIGNVIQFCGTVDQYQRGKVLDRFLKQDHSDNVTDYFFSDVRDVEVVVH